MSWAVIGTTVASAAITAGAAYASAPDYPNPAASSRRTVLADITSLPGRRMVDMAARLGIPVDFPTGRMVPRYAEKTLRQALDDGDLTQHQYEEYIRTQPTATLDSMIRVRVGNQPEMQHADFTGYGDADVQGAVARRMAQIQLDLSRKYGDQFIDEARRQEELANPEGTEARRMLAESINRMEDERGTRPRPVADMLDAQMLQDLRTGRGATPETDAEVAKVIAAREGSGAGGTVGAGDVGSELESGARGQARLNSRVRNAMSYLTSGATPEDVDYRRRQQSMANMAAFLSGQTPEAQFQTLSGGQQGATPVARGPNLIGANPNIQQFGNQAGLQQANLATAGASNQAGWFAGLATLARGLNVAGAAGWQPFRS